MSRDEGFARADIDTGLLADPKVARLARRLRDPRAVAVHTLLYTAVVLESWATGARVPFGDALPAWWLDEADAELAILIEVGLLDADGLIPDVTWEVWFGPARERRIQRIEAGARGGRAKADRARSSVAELQRGSSEAMARLERGSSAALPSQPTVPTNHPTVPSGRARDTGPTPIGALIREGANGRPAIIAVATARGVSVAQVLREGNGDG